MTDPVALGTDLGGTFTDIVLVADGELTVAKAPAALDQEVGFLDAVGDHLEAAEVEPAAVERFAHGTTVGTNAVLEDDLAPTALVTNEGFRDVLEIGRQDRPALYDLSVEAPRPVIERDRRFTVDCRVDETGTVEVDLSDDDLGAVVEAIRGADVAAVAVSLLFAFEHPDHERAIRDALSDALPSLSVSLSSEVHPEIREYERTLVTAINAGLQPVFEAYLDAVDRGFDRLGLDVPLAVMQSHGGTIEADVARERPVTTLLSGPAAGVEAAAHLGALSGHTDVITMDMGGTSCDVSLVAGGEPVRSTDVELGGRPIPVSMVDVHTIGAGGGSIGWIDAGGALRVGPQSAGAEPGPVCYGQGGQRPTVTDAHLLLGRLRPDAMLSAELAGDEAAVEAAFERELADPLGLSTTEAAAGILEVANASMERALRVISVERGHDPRRHALVAFGGAGPLHASALAPALGIETVIVPRHAGVLSALGLLLADEVHEHSQSMVRPLAAVDGTELRERFDALADAADTRLRGDDTAVRHERAIEARYVGQSYELRVPVEGELTDPSTLETVAERFHAMHEMRFGHAARDDPIEVVTLRLRAVATREPPPLAAVPQTGELADASIESGPVWFDGGFVETRRYDRTVLPTGTGFDGPAVIEGPDSTVVVEPGQSARVDEHGSLIIEVGR